MTDKKEIRSFSCSGIEVRAESEDSDPVIEGYAAVFDSVTQIGSYFREVIKPGAFKRAIEENQDVRALVDHDPSRILARTKANSLELSEDDKGLKVRFKPPKTSLGADLVENLRNGNLTQMSFAFIPKRASWIEEEGQLDLRQIEDVDLYDVSVVTYPAFEETSVYLRSLEGVLKECEARHSADKRPNGLLKLRLQLSELA